MRSVLFALVLTLPFAACAPPETEPPDGDSAVAVAPTPASGDDTNGLEECAEAGPLTVCQLYDAERDSTYFEVREGTRAPTTFPAPSWGAATSDGWTAHHRDLDGDGQEELVIPFHTGTSNGMAVRYWRLFILPLPASSGPATPLVAETEEFGPDGLEGSLLLAEFADAPDPEGRLGDGSYLIGRPFRYAAGRLVPQADAPVRARRLLEAFMRERFESEPPTPRAWLTAEQAEVRTTDPVLQGLRAVPEATGTVEQVVWDGGELVRLVLTDGTSVVYDTDSWERAPDAAGYLGDAASERLYPPGYVPADLSAWLTGRNVRATAYQDADGTPATRVIWVE